MHIFVYKYVSHANLHLYISVQSLSCVQLFVTLWTTAHQASLFITNYWSLLKLISIKLVMPSNHLILCHPLLLLPSIFLTIRVFSNELALCIHITYFSDCFMKNYNSLYFYQWSMRFCFSSPSPLMAGLIFLKCFSSLLSWLYIVHCCSNYAFPQLLGKFFSFFNCSNI